MLLEPKDLAPLLVLARCAVALLAIAGIGGAVAGSVAVLKHHGDVQVEAREG